MRHHRRFRLGALSLALGMVVVPAAGQTGEGKPRLGRSPTARGIEPPGPATISQSVSMNVTVGNSIACAAGGVHSENSYYRAFTLAEYPALDSVQFMVQNVVIGVESADDGSGAGQPLSLRLHKSTTNPPTLASLTLVSTTDFTIPDQSRSLLSLDVAIPPVLINATDILVVEILTPDGTADGHFFLIGSNPSGQSAPSYIRAPSCGLFEITDLASVSFPFMHVVMTVSGNNQVPVTLQGFEVR